MARNNAFWTTPAERRHGAMQKIDDLALRINLTKHSVQQGRLDTRTGFDRAADYLVKIEELSIELKAMRPAA